MDYYWQLVNIDMTKSEFETCKLVLKQINDHQINHIFLIESLKSISNTFTITYGEDGIISIITDIMTCKSILYRQLEECKLTISLHRDENCKNDYTILYKQLYVHFDFIFKKININ